MLVVMHKQILPHLTNPRLLIDFLIDSYNRGVCFCMQFSHDRASCLWRLSAFSMVCLCGSLMT